MMFQSLLCVRFCCSSLLFNDVEGANLGIRTWRGGGVAFGYPLTCHPSSSGHPSPMRICFFAV